MTYRTIDAFDRKRTGDQVELAGSVSLWSRALSVSMWDIPLAVGVLLSQLNSTLSLGFLASAPVKTGVLMLCVICALRISSWHDPLDRRTCVVFGLAGCYAVLLGVVSALNQLPAQRYLLLAQLVVLLCCFSVHALYRPGRLLAIVVWAALLHMVLAVLVNDRVAWIDGEARLAGGSHPLTLGFEAVEITLTGVLLVFAAKSLRTFMVGAFVTAGALYVAYLAFARQAFVGGVIGLIVVLIFSGRRLRFARFLVATSSAAVLTVVLDGGNVIALFGGSSEHSLLTLTGRTQIWSRIAAFVSDGGFWFGYGYASLNDGAGPDAMLLIVVRGENAENAVLQALLNGGIIGLGVWVLFIAASLALAVQRFDRVYFDHLAVWTLLPAVLASAVVGSALTGQGVQWWWFLALIEFAIASCGNRAQYPADSLRKEL